MTTTSTPADLGTILSVWAHPDDETYLAGGLMAAAVDRGQRVVCATASAGEHGTDDPEAWPPGRLARVRQLEAAAAMAVLGVTEHHLLGLPDGELSGHDRAGVALVGRLLDHVRPDTIVTFGPDGMTGHPDHKAVHRWVTEAWDRRGRTARLLLATSTAEHVERFRPFYEEMGVYMSDERPPGLPAACVDVLVRLEGSDLDRKVAALRAMATQTAGVLATVDLETYVAEVAEEAFVDAPMARPSGLSHRAKVRAVRHGDPADPIYGPARGDARARAHRPGRPLHL